MPTFPTSTLSEQPFRCKVCRAPPSAAGDAGLLRIASVSLNLRMHGLNRRANQARHSQPLTLGLWRLSANTDIDPIPGMQRTSHSMSKTERERNLAVFIDLENLAMGFQGQRKIRFEVQK